MKHMHHLHEVPQWTCVFMLQKAETSLIFKVKTMRKYEKIQK